MARPQGLRQNWRRRTKKSCSLLSRDPPITPPGGSVGVVPANGGGLGLGGVASAFCADCPPPPPARVGPVLAGPLSPCPVPRAGCAARRAQSCQACPPEVLYVGPVLSGPLLPRPIFCVGRTGTVGIPLPMSAPPCSSWQWQAQSCQACPLDALRVGPVLLGPLLPRPVFCAGRTGTVGRPAPLMRCKWVQSCQAHSFLALFPALGAPVRWGYPPPCLPSRAVFGGSRPSLVRPTPSLRRPSRWAHTPFPAPPMRVPAPQLRPGPVLPGPASIAPCSVQARWHAWRARPPAPLPRSGTGASTSDRPTVWGPNLPFPGRAGRPAHVLAPGDGTADASCRGLAGHPPPPLFSLSF